MTTLIALMGAKQSGKDTLADYLVRTHGYTRLAFADILKDALLAVDPIVECYDEEGYHLYDRLSDIVGRIGMDRAKEEFPEVRRLLQEFGVRLRDVDPLIWVRGVERQMDSIDGPVIVTDVRFPNEYEWAESRQGLLTRIVRPGLRRTDFHASEDMAWDTKGYPDRYRVINGGTIGNLHVIADHLASVAARTY